MSCRQQYRWIVRIASIALVAITTSIPVFAQESGAPASASSVQSEGADRESLLVDLTQGIAALRREVDSLRAEVAHGAGRPASARSDSALAMAAKDSARSVQRHIDEIGQGVGGLFVPILLSLLAIAIIYFLIKAVVWILEVSAERNATSRLLFKRMIPVVRVVLWSIGIYVILAFVLRISANQILTASAALGVAIGFAAQDVLKNIFGGIIILLDKPFQVGDKIRVGGTYGEVVSIGLRSTRLTTPDDNLVSVPNAQVVDGQVANANAGALDCQVVTELFLPGWVDVAKAKSIAYNAAANSEYVFLDKPIVVLVQDDFKETFLTRLVVKAYVLDTRYETRFASDVTEMAKVEFLREGMLAPLVGLDTIRQTIDPSPGENGKDR